MKRLLMFFLLLKLTATAQTGDTLLELNPKNFNPDFSNYNQKTALFMGQLSELAYTKSLQPFNRFMLRYLDLYSIPVHTAFIREKSRGTNTVLLLWGMPDHLIISVRGTQFNKGNIITDVKYLNYDERTDDLKAEYYNLPGGHGGFRSAIRRLIREEDLMGQLEVFIKQAYPTKSVRDVPVYLTGHSLGAGIASMLAEPLRVKGLNVKGLYLFAPPLSVSCEEVNYMGTKFPNTYNIVNYKDYVPRAGLRGSLAHYGHFYRICDDSTLATEPERYVKMTWPEKKKELEYHNLGNHLKLLRLTKNNERDVLARRHDCFEGMEVIKTCPK